MGQWDGCWVCVEGSWAKKPKGPGPGAVDILVMTDVLWMQGKQTWLQSSRTEIDLMQKPCHWPSLPDPEATAGLWEGGLQVSGPWLSPLALDLMVCVLGALGAPSE